MRHAIILAGGKSTRVACKVYMTMKNGQPLYMSAVEAARQLADAITIWINEHQWMPDLMDVEVKRDAHGGIQKILDQYPKGTYVLFADNIYGQATIDAAKELPYGHAITCPMQHDQLDYWAEGKWWSYEDGPGSGFGMASPWKLGHSRKKGDLKPFGPIYDPAWLDLGTETAVRRYFFNENI